MSQLFQFIQDIFTFSYEDQMVSVLFYLAMLVFPLVTYFGGNAAPQLVPKVTRYLTYVIMAILIVGSLVLSCQVIQSEEQIPGKEEYTYDTGKIGLLTDMTIYSIFFLFGLTIGYGILWIIANGRKSLPLVVAVGLFAIIMIISYSTASTEISPKLLENLATMPTEQEIKDGSAGIIAVTIFGVMAVLAWVLGEIYNVFKR